MLSRAEYPIFTSNQKLMVIRQKGIKGPLFSDKVCNVDCILTSQIIKIQIRQNDSIIMVKIKIFKSSDEGELEKGVNSYLEQVGRNNLINIKYSMTFKDNEMYHSAMIIYEEAKEGASKSEKTMYE
jgi:hypothetical protein